MVMIRGAHSSDDREDRTPNPGLVPDDVSCPRWPILFRAPIRIAAGMCGSCSRPVDTFGHCACSE
ncbi:hypothetical protein FrEUN1fDRAFT_7867 [Parafrankia sp. EUN1f]|nr:hypothetical protein FrEUN1fDRAFT_7867 [Parafrankia sp. EUN1f]